MLCCVHGKTRSKRSLENVPGTDLWRCIEKETCKIGATLVQPEPNPEEEKVMCQTHNKLRLISFMASEVGPDSEVIYRCKPETYCKPGFGGAVRRNTVPAHRDPYPTPYPYPTYPPYQPQLPLGFPHHPPPSHPPHVPHVPHAPHAHAPAHAPAPHAPHSYPYQYPVPHSFLRPEPEYRNPQSTTEKEVCHVHGKTRTLENLENLGNGIWRCASHRPCRTGRDTQ